MPKTVYIFVLFLRTWLAQQRNDTLEVIPRDAKPTVMANIDIIVCDTKKNIDVQHTRHRPTDEALRIFNEVGETKPPQSSLHSTSDIVSSEESMSDTDIFNDSNETNCMDFFLNERPDISYIKESKVNCVPTNSNNVEDGSQWAAWIKSRKHGNAYLLMRMIHHLPHIYDGRARLVAFVDMHEILFPFCEMAKCVIFEQKLNELNDNIGGSLFYQCDNRFQVMFAEKKQLYYIGQLLVDVTLLEGQIHFLFDEKIMNHANGMIHDNPSHVTSATEKKIDDNPQTSGLEAIANTDQDCAREKMPPGSESPSRQINPMADKHTSLVYGATFNDHTLPVCFPGGKVTIDDMYVASDDLAQRMPYTRNFLQRLSLKAIPQATDRADKILCRLGFKLASPVEAQLMVRVKAKCGDADPCGKLFTVALLKS